jgi:hypothetical protein
MGCFARSGTSGKLLVKAGKKAIFALAAATFTSRFGRFLPLTP